MSVCFRVFGVFRGECPHRAQPYDPLHNAFLSTLVAALPVVVLLASMSVPTAPTRLTALQTSAPMGWTGLTGV